MQQNISHQAIFYPRSVYKSKSYDLDEPVFADYKYNIELVGLGVGFKYFPEVVCVFNEHGQSSERNEAFIRRLPGLIRQNFGIRFFIIKLLRNFAVRVLKGGGLRLLSRVRGQLK